MYLLTFCCGFFFHGQTFHELILDAYHLIIAGKTINLHCQYSMRHLFIRRLTLNCYWSHFFPR